MFIGCGWENVIDPRWIYESRMRLLLQHHGQHRGFEQHAASFDCRHLRATVEATDSNSQTQTSVGFMINKSDSTTYSTKQPLPVGSIHLSADSTSPLNCRLPFSSAMKVKYWQFWRFHVELYLNVKVLSIIWMSCYLKVLMLLLLVPSDLFLVVSRSQISAITLVSTVCYYWLKRWPETLKQNPRIQSVHESSSLQGLSRQLQCVFFTCTRCWIFDFSWIYFCFFALYTACLVIKLPSAQT